MFLLQELAKYSGKYMVLEHEMDLCLKLADEAKQLADRRVEAA
jgi:hypothetical protein